jgi:hypothetical protein
MEEDFNIEEEYEKYKASQQGPDTRPEWMRSAEEDLKGFLEKPEFNRSAEMSNFFAQRKKCDVCGKELPILNFKRHYETCEKNINLISLLLKENPDYTLVEIMKKTGLISKTVHKVLDKLGLKHKFSDFSEAIKVPSFKQKIMEASKKGNQSWSAERSKINQKIFSDIYNVLPEKIISLSELNKEIEKVIKLGPKRKTKFLEEKWVIMIFEGNKFDSVKPPLFIKNPEKSTDLNYKPLVYNNKIIQEKLEKIRKQFSGEIKSSMKKSDKN